MSNYGKYSLVGVDGNAFSVMAYVSNALKKEGYKDRIEEYQQEATKDNYDNLLSVSCDWLDKINKRKLGIKKTVEHNDAYKNNEKLVLDFLKKHKLEDETILGLEVFGQISDGEFEDCHSYDMDWGNCINELKNKYPLCKHYTEKIYEEWDEYRRDLNFSPEGDFFEFEEGELDISKGYTASILPASIKEDVLN